MAKNYIWVLFLTIYCSVCLIWQNSYQGKNTLNERNQSSFIERGELYSSGDHQGWNGSRHEAGYKSVSKLNRLLKVNWDTKESTIETNKKGGHNNKLNVYSGANPRISRFISYNEATHSEYAKIHKIKNDPSPEQLKVMSHLGVNLFDKIRLFFKSPIYITSFFRSKILNERLGGAVYSDHMVLDDCAGIDMDMDGKYGPTNNQLFFHIKKNMPYYKLIAEFPVKGKLRWVHVSYSTDERKNAERNTYIAIMKGKRKVYIPYLGNEHLIK